eukprot:s4263_g2.t3
MKGNARAENSWENLLDDGLHVSLQVDDILEWRVTSRQTRSPRVLLRHIAEMGRLDRSESILDYSKKLDLLHLYGDTFDADVCGNDAVQIKYYDCQWWCKRLANTRHTHFAESDAFEIVCPNLRDLLRHCADEDASVRTSAHRVVRSYGKGGLPFVRQMIADAMLTLMGHVLSESTGISQATLPQVMQCTRHLDNVVRALAKPQRQQWVSLLVKALESLRGHESHPETLTLISDLKLLWRADDDPSRSYAEAEQQLKALMKKANADASMPNKETDKKEEATEQARRDAKDAFKAKQVAEDAKAEKISALQDAADAKKLDVQKLEEMLKEEQERNEKNKKDAEEAARQKEEQQAKLEEKNKELTMAVRELQDPPQSEGGTGPLASRLAKVTGGKLDTERETEVLAHVHSPRELGNNSKSCRGLQRKREAQVLTHPQIRSRWSS